MIRHLIAEALRLAAAILDRPTPAAPTPAKSAVPAAQRTAPEHRRQPENRRGRR